MPVAPMTSNNRNNDPLVWIFLARFRGSGASAAFSDSLSDTCATCMTKKRLEKMAKDYEAYRGYRGVWSDGLLIGAYRVF